MNNKSVLFWEISGAFFFVIVGALLHFTFEWSNQLPIVGVVSPVNESVWEHLKLGFWSLVFFCLIEYWFIKKEIRNFFLAKGLRVLVLQGSILFLMVFSGKVSENHFLNMFYQETGSQNKIYFK